MQNEYGSLDGSLIISYFCYRLGVVHIPKKIFDRMGRYDWLMKYAKIIANKI
jgi:hypothetical protein